MTVEAASSEEEEEIGEDLARDTLSYEDLTDGGNDVSDVETEFEDWTRSTDERSILGLMERCAVHECLREATEPFTILDPRRRIFRKRDKVVVETMICTEHNAAVEAGAMCAYRKPPGRLWVMEPSSA